MNNSYQASSLLCRERLGPTNGGKASRSQVQAQVKIQGEVNCAFRLRGKGESSQRREAQGWASLRPCRQLPPQADLGCL